MRLYVGTYHKYNCGSLKGEWVELDEFNCKDDFLEYCGELHSDEQDPEFMFQDCDEMPPELYNESYVSELIWDVLELDEYQRKQFELYIEATGADIEGALECYQDMFYFRRQDTFETIAELYHDAVKQIEACNLDFITIDEDAFRRQYTEVHHGKDIYYCDTNF